MKETNFLLPPLPYAEPPNPLQLLNYCATCIANTSQMRTGLFILAGLACPGQERMGTGRHERWWSRRTKQSSWQWYYPSMKCRQVLKWVKQMLIPLSHPQMFIIVSSNTNFFWELSDLIRLMESVLIMYICSNFCRYSTTSLGSFLLQRKGTGCFRKLGGSLWKGRVTYWRTGSWMIFAPLNHLTGARANLMVGSIYNSTTSALLGDSKWQ